MEEENVATEWQIEDLNPGDLGCLSVDSCPGTGRVTTQKIDFMQLQTAVPSAGCH